MAIIALWFGISVPLVFLGAYVGFRKDTMEFPVHPRADNMPRQIPDQPWYLSYSFTVVIGGILPFGACFVELFFILSSMWMDQYYYVFGFTLIVFFILCITCAEVTMVLIYFQVRSPPPLSLAPSRPPSYAGRVHFHVTAPPALTHACGGPVL